MSKENDEKKSLAALTTKKRTTRLIYAATLWFKTTLHVIFF